MSKQSLYVKSGAPPFAKLNEVIGVVHFVSYNIAFKTFVSSVNILKNYYIIASIKVFTFTALAYNVTLTG